MRYPWSRALLALTIVVLMSVTASAAVVYVKWDSPGPTFDGTSWETAYHTIMPYLQAAKPGDEVWVARGRYVVRAMLPSGVGLYGGFAGNEVTRDERDSRDNETVLDGNRGRVVIPQPGATADTVVDGFTITNGDSIGKGGGILCASSSPTISNNIIIGNNAEQGGAISCDASSAVIVGNRISGNSAPSGSGIYCCNGSSPVISGNEITANTAPTSWRAAGIESVNSAPVITGNTITAHAGRAVSCQSSTGIISGNVLARNDGGGVKCSSSAPVVSNNVIMLSGTGIYCSGSASPVIVNNTIVGNTNGATSSGVYCSSTSSPAVTNNIIAFNMKGLYNDGGSPVLRNNCVFGHQSDNYSGVSPGAGDVVADPGFACAEYGNLHLRSDSPCVDAGLDSVDGLPLVDMDGRNRVDGSAVDIGADEYDLTEWTPGPYVIVRVSPDGDDANDGSTWALAKKTLQAAIDVASAQGGDVWVRRGRYVESLSVRAFAHVYGGFKGNETCRDERDWSSNETMLNGDQGGSVVTFSEGVGLWTSTIDGLAIIGSATGSGVFCSGCSPIIVNNDIRGNRGSGVNCTYSSASVIGNVVSGNTDGGIACSFSRLTITGNTIVGNTGADYGRGVYCRSSQCTVANNVVSCNAFGIYDDSGLSELRHNCVYGNLAYDYSGVSAGIGDISADPRFASAEYGDFHLQPDSPCINAGANDAPGLPICDADGRSRMEQGTVDIGAYESDGSIWPSGPYVTVRVSPEGDDLNDGSSWTSAKKTIHAAVIAASARGGEVWAKAGTYFERIVLQPYAYVYGGFTGTEVHRSERNWFSNATVLDGSSGGSVIAIRAGHAVSAIDGFTIRNASGYYCAGIDCSDSSPMIRNNRVTSSRCDGIRCYNASPLIHSCMIDRNSYHGVECYLSSPTIAGCTISRNGDFVGHRGIFLQRSSPILTNSVVAFNQNGIYSAWSSTPVLRNCNVFGSVGSDIYGIADPTGTDGNISADPLFVDRANGDYHLKPISPCVNAGSNGAPGLPSTDIDGEARVLYGVVDIGADECSGTIDVLREAKMAANGLPISLTDAIVTATLDGFFYIEAPNRSVGIRVEKSAHGLTAGDTVNVTGTMGTNADGERFIEAFSVVRTGSGSIDPLHINPAALGGGDWRYVPSTGAGQKGIVGGLGLNNIGMYVRTWGRLTYVGGSYVLSGTGLTPSDKHVLEGLRTICRETYVRVHGVVSCYRAADGLHPIIIATEIQPL